jgi:hypothetical protein
VEKNEKKYEIDSRKKLEAIKSISEFLKYNGSFCFEQNFICIEGRMKESNKNYMLGRN